MTKPQRNVSLGSIVLLVGSFIGGGLNLITLALAIALLALSLLHWGKSLMIYSIPGIAMAAVALLVSVVNVLPTWGVSIWNLQGRAGIGPYLSIIGSVIALYGASRKVGFETGLLEPEHTPEDVVWR